MEPRTHALVAALLLIGWTAFCLLLAVWLP